MDGQPTCKQTARSEVRLGPLFRRRIRLARVGDAIPAHDHPFDHVTFVWKGRVRIDLRDPSCDCKSEHVCQSGDMVLVKAGIEHTITALEDDCAADCLWPASDAPGAYR